MKRLLLVGGGHAQLAVLQALARQRPRAVEAVLLTPSPWQWYSGMLPGWMAGHYRAEDCRIDLHPLAAAGTGGEQRRHQDHHSARPLVHAPLPLP